MSTHIFVGPTIAAQTVRDRIPEAVVHPPVRHGDLLALSLRPGDVVAIVDGMFFRTGAIRHKEVLHVIQNGIHVWGASSMGALRAAELDVFGMRGVGQVYDMYAGGIISADDEVAVMHADANANYRSMNEALVSVRLAARRAREDDVIAADDEQLLVQAARGLFFADRTYPRIIESARAAGLSEQPAAAFSEYVAASRPDVKREDAELLLKELSRWLADPQARDQERQPRATGTAPRMEMTSFLLRWIRTTPNATIDGERVSDMAALSACQLFAADYPTFHYAFVLRELVRGELGAAACPSGEDDLATWEQLACDAAVRRGLVATGTESIPASLAAWVSEPDRERPVREAIARALVRSYRWAPNVRPVEPLVDKLADTDAWTAAQRCAAQASKLNAQLAEMKASFNVHYISDGKLESWLHKRWETTDLRFAMQDRGFASRADLRARAAEFLPLDSLRGVAPFRVGAAEEVR